MAILLFTDKLAVSTDFKGFADTYFQIFKDLYEYYQSGVTQRVICRLFATVSRIRQVSKRAGKLIPALTFYLFDHKEKQSHFPFFIFIIACIFLRISSSLSSYSQTISPMRESIAHSAPVSSSSS